MTTINKNKINEALILLESKAQNSNKMNKLKSKLLKESEEDLELDTLAQEVADADEESIETLEEIPTDEENLETEEEETEYVDVTGGVAEKNGVFTVQTTAEVVLAPGNKIKFLVGDEEFKGTVGEPTDEEGVLTIEIDEDEEALETSDEEALETSDEEALETSGEEELETDEEIDSIVEEILLEEELGDAAEGLEEIPTDNTDSIDNTEGLEEIPTDEENLGDGVGDLGTDIGMNLGTDTSSTPELSDTSNDGIESTETDLDQIIDTDELVNELLGQEEENPLDVELASKLNEEILDEEIDSIINEVLAENVAKENPNYKKATNEEKPTAKLGDKDIEGKVKEGGDSKAPGVKGFKPNPVAKQTDVQSKKLKTEDPKNTVSQTKATKEKPEEITSKVKQSGDAHIDPKDDFNSKVKQDSNLKSKALVKLAEDFVKIQNEVKKLRFENYKLLKVNGLLTLLPELEQSTRESLCEKFDRCNNESQVSGLYKKITGIVKESRKPSLNQVITEKRKDISSFSTNKVHDIKTLKETVDRTQNNKGEEISAEQRRKNHLMGLSNDEGYYKNLQ